MDPVTLIVAALGAGLAAAGQAAVGEAVKDAYDRLKSLLAARFSHKPEHQAALVGFEGNADATAPTLAAAVSDSGAQNDPEVLDAARKLLAVADPDGGAAQKFTNLIQNVHGFVQGNQNTVTMNFGEPETKP